MSSFHFGLAYWFDFGGGVVPASFFNPTHPFIHVQNT